MAQARSAVTTLPASRVQIIAPSSLGETAIAALRARGIAAHVVDELIPSDDVVAWALDRPPTGAAAVELGAACARAAAAGRPICLLAPPPRGSGRAAIERAAALAYLRAHGAALGHDVDSWLEAVVMLVRFGMPSGPHAAVIAPPGSRLEAQTLGLAAEAELAGVRPPLVGTSEATDVALYDPALGVPPSSTPGLHVPVIARAELADGSGALFGVRGALGATLLLGRAAERIAAGLGPAPASASAELSIDQEKLARQLNKLASASIGDHETKVLLSAYGVPVTRQKVAETASAAIKIARVIGFPVEIKPWSGDGDLPTEPDGCPIRVDLTSDAMVRAGFAAMIAANPSKRSDHRGEAVIVRGAPPAGRELAVTFLKLAALGWTVVLDGQHIAAAPAPLRLVDAQQLAGTLVASRAGEPELDRVGLANILRRVSHLVVDLDVRLVRLELSRVVVPGPGARAVVVDAFAELR